MSNKATIQQQFGENAQAYVESTTHRTGASLARLLEIAPPDRSWRVLDVAAAIGYTAFAFAPHVAHVWVTDITAQMLELARLEADSRGLTNVTVEYADADALPYEPDSYDLVTCRIAAHHFADVARFVSEARRVLRPGGLLALVDNVAPEGPGGDYVNAFEKLRDPSHVRCLALKEWRDNFEAQGLTVEHAETLDKRIEFAFWSKRHDAATQQFLRTMLLYAPQPAAGFLRVERDDGDIHFHLQEGIVLGRKSVSG